MSTYSCCLELCEMTCPSGYYGSNCQSQCSCNLASSTCDPTNGNCLCSPGYSGSDCAKRRLFCLFVKRWSVFHNLHLKNGKRCIHLCLGKRAQSLEDRSCNEISRDKTFAFSFRVKQTLRKCTLRSNIIKVECVAIKYVITIIN